MTKSDLIDVLCETQKLPKGRAELLVHVIFDALEAALKRGERIEIRGFGSFELRNYRGYDGRNPRTGQRGRRAPEAPALLQGRQGAEGARERRAVWRHRVPRPSAPRSPTEAGRRPCPTSVDGDGSGRDRQRDDGRAADARATARDDRLGAARPILPACGERER